MPSDDALLFSDDAGSLSNDAFASSHDNATSSNGALAPSDTQVHQYCTDDVALVLSNV